MIRVLDERWLMTNGVYAKMKFVKIFEKTSADKGFNLMILYF